MILLLFIFLVLIALGFLVSGEGQHYAGRNRNDLNQPKRKINITDKNFFL